MAFCSNCGEKLTGQPNFCPKCGKPLGSVGQDKSQESPHIAVVKCPCCGNSVNSYAAKCPSCGTEMRVTGASNAVKEFADRITSCTTEEKKVELIKSYPVPNSREDIYDFLILASTNITPSQNAVVNEAWNAKFEQAFQKPRLCLPETRSSQGFSATTMPIYQV